MIRINIEVDTVVEARRALQDLLGTTSEAPPTAEPAAPKPTSRGKKAAAEEPAAGNSTGDATSQGAGSSVADEGKGSANSLDKDALAARCTAYGQKAGREALKQLFIVLGAPDGKWTQVPADKYPALDQSLTDFGF